MHTGIPRRSEAAMAVLSVLATFATCCFPGPSRADAAPDADAATATRVKAALAAGRHLLARHINVSVTSGPVRLGGLVESEDALQPAKRDAESVPGVVSLEDRMELMAPPRATAH